VGSHHAQPRSKLPGLDEIRDPRVAYRLGIRGLLPDESHRDSKYQGQRQQEK
jgi:hypothetical protein